MEAIKLLSDFLAQPVDTITAWLDSMSLAMSEWWSTLWTDIAINVTEFLVEGVAVVVIVYSVYCACRVMCTTKDDTFSEYINKSMLAGLGYFFAKYGGRLLLTAIGA